ncbi:MAG: carbohydrate ABC transporter permease [Treponema sp.]|jgi:multiple sugar transport system permease protein|nr:carbohydrate ABC transporter permease [Treponema sp.]
MKKTKKAVDNNGIIRDFDFKQRSVRVFYAILYGIGIIIAFVGIAPLIWVVFSGFKDIREFVRDAKILPSKFNLDVYSTTWKQLGFVRYYVNSLVSVVGSVVCAVFFNGLLGYALSKIKPAGSKVVYMLVMWGLLIPTTTSVVPLFINITRIRLTGSFIPLWLSMGASAFYVILFKNFFDELPASLIEAAKIDGAKDFAIFTKIAVPLSQAIIMVVVMYAINAAWSDFLLPYLVLNGSSFETVMVRLFQFKNGKSNDVEILRAVVFALIPPIVLFFIFQKQITQVALQSGIKG